MVAARAAVLRVDDLRVDHARALAAVLVEGPCDLGELDQALVARHPQFPAQPPTTPRAWDTPPSCAAAPPLLLAGKMLGWT